MDTELLVEERTEGGRDFLHQLEEDGFPVSVAFWVQTAEDAEGDLYLASDQIDPNRLADAYRAIYASLRKLPSTCVVLSDIKLLPTADPIAQAAIAVRDRHVGRFPIHYQGKRLGPMAIEAAYIYPRCGIMSFNEILQTISTLMNRTGVVQPSAVTLHNGTSFLAIPVGVNLQSPGTVDSIVVTLHDVTTGENQPVSIRQIIRIR